MCSTIDSGRLWAAVRLPSGETVWKRWAVTVPSIQAARGYRWMIFDSPKAAYWQARLVGGLTLTATERLIKRLWGNNAASHMPEWELEEAARLTGRKEQARVALIKKYGG